MSGKQPYTPQERNTFDYQKSCETIVAHLETEAEIGRLAEAYSAAGDPRPRESAERAVKLVGYLFEEMHDDLNVRDLAKCDPSDFTAALLKLAAQGLSPDFRQGIAYLTARPHKMKMRVVPVPGVRGREKKVMETGLVATILSFPVRAQDSLDVCLIGRPESPIIFRPNLSPDPTKPNDFVASVTEIAMKDGRRYPVFRRIDRVEVTNRYDGKSKLALRDATSDRILNTAKMDEQSAVRYASLRPALLHIMQTIAHESPMVMASFLQLNQEAFQESEDLSLNEDAGVSPQSFTSPAAVEQPSPPAQAPAAPSSAAVEQPSPPAQAPRSALAAFLGHVRKEFEAAGKPINPLVDKLADFAMSEGDQAIRNRSGNIRPVVHWWKQFAADQNIPPESAPGFSTVESGVMSRGGQSPINQALSNVRRKAPLVASAQEELQNGSKI